MDKVRAKLYAPRPSRDTVSVGNMQNFSQPELLEQLNKSAKTPAKTAPKKHAPAKSAPAPKQSKPGDFAMRQSAQPNGDFAVRQDAQPTSAKRVFEEEKFDLLERKSERCIDSATWPRALGVYLLIVLLASLYIFVREKIYLSSKEYAELEGKKEVLIEENKELERKIEALQFKNKITNYFEVKYE